MYVILSIMNLFRSPPSQILDALKLGERHQKRLSIQQKSVGGSGKGGKKGGKKGSKKGRAGGGRGGSGSGIGVEMSSTNGGVTMSNPMVSGRLNHMSSSGKGVSARRLSASNSDSNSNSDSCVGGRSVRMSIPEEENAEQVEQVEQVERVDRVGGSMLFGAGEERALSSSNRKRGSVTMGGGAIYHPQGSQEGENKGAEANEGVNEGVHEGVGWNTNPLSNSEARGRANRADTSGTVVL